MTNPEFGYNPGQEGSFTHILGQNGFKVVEDVEQSGDRKTTIDVPEGRYHIVAGFPEFDPTDKKFFYGNNVVEMQHQPLELDFNAASFQRLAEELRGKLKEGQDLKDIIATLDGVIQKTVRSDAQDERITKMSQILEKGHSACTGKVLVSAGLLKAVRPESDVQLIYGASSSFEDRRPNDIGHIWLRIVQENDVVLYDPYYKHLVPYDLEKPRSFIGDPFAGYSVGAYFAANVVNQLPVRTTDRRFTKLVGETSGNKSVWIADEKALASQIFGEMNFEFDTNKSGKLCFINKGLFSARGDGAGFGYPLREITKVEQAE